jgi:hypothetical protein
MNSKLLTEELLKQINLINYDRSKTLIENKIIINEQSNWAKTEEGKNTIKFLTDLGHDRFILQGATSSNNAFNLAAVSAIRKLNEKLVEINYNQTDPFFRISVLKQKPSGGVQKFSSFDLNMVEKLKNNIDLSEKSYSVDVDNFKRSEISTNRTIGGTFILEDFYFNYGEIFNTVKNLNSSENYLFPDGVYNFFTQYYGGDNVNTIKTSIEVQNVSNRPKLNPGDGWKQISFTNRVTNETDWKPIVETLHIVLPATSFILNVFGGPPGIVIGAALETIDAGLYQFYDEDPYMAGLSLIFALVPLTELASLPGFKQVTKEGVQEGLEKLLWKRVRKEPLTNEEEIFLKAVAGSKKVQKEFYNAVITTSLRKVLVENPKGYVNIISWFLKKGILTFQQYSTIINLVWGTYVYDYWAYHNLGKCSASFKFSDLLKLIPETEGYSVKNLIRNIELQPFTNTQEMCDQIVQIKLLKEKEKLKKEIEKSFSKLASTVVEGLIKNKFILSTNVSTSFEYEVGLIQTVLYQCGFAKKTITTNFKNNKVVFNNASNIEKVLITNVTGGIIEKITNDGKNTFSSKPITNTKGIILLSIYEKGSDKPMYAKIFPNQEGIYNIGTYNEKFNWGYFDDVTKKSVENLQKYFNLSVDGVVGPDTLKALLSLIKNQKCGLLINHSKLELTPENENLINDKVVENYLKSLTSLPKPNFDPDNLTPEQQDKLDKSLKKYLNFGTEQNFDETINKIESEL